MTYSKTAIYRRRSINIHPKITTAHMNNLFRGLLAGYGAKKLGGGCLSTILIFIVLWVILGQCQ